MGMVTDIWAAADEATITGGEEDAVTITDGIEAAVTATITDGAFAAFARHLLPGRCANDSDANGPRP